MGNSLSGNGLTIFSADYLTWPSQIPSVLNYGVKGDGTVLTKALSITSGAAILTAASGEFTISDVGKTIFIPGAGAAAAPLISTITAFASATEVTLANNAGTTLSAASTKFAYGTDETVAINTALALAIGPIYFPSGIYLVSDEITWPDHSGIIGSGPHWKRRTTQTYDGSAQTVFKYIGVGGTDSCVVRASNTAVGVEAASPSDDLTDYAARSFHIDASGVAEYGFYSYRAGNCASQGDITAEAALEYNIVHIGTFAAEFGTFGSYEAVGQGIACGWNIFSWSSNENTNFAFRVKYLSANNGTSEVYVSGTGTDQDNSGGKFSVGRGSEIYIRSEGNFGRACILAQPVLGGATNGPSIYNLEYVEGNGDGAYIRYRDSNDAILIRNGFIHPGNGSTLNSQNFFVSGQSDAGSPVANSGPTDSGKWLVFDSLQGNLGGTGFEIYSNTYKYRVQGCDRSIVYGLTRPNQDDYIATSAQAGAHIYFTAAASPTIWNSFNCSLARQSAGLYRITFDRDFASGVVPTAIATIAISAALDTNVRPTSIATTTMDVTTYDNSGSAADTGDRISVVCFGRLV